MSYKTILACLTDRHSTEKLVRFAAGVAERFDGHLIGLHVVRQAELHAGVAPYVSDLMLAEMRHNMEEEARGFRAAFEAGTSGRAFVAEWRDTSAQTVEVGDKLVEHALAADLIVMAQPEPARDSDDRSELHRKLILGAGRPVLVMPHTGHFERMGSKVLVCWNATRESSRAAHDALPFLKAAEEVVIFGIEDRDSSAEPLRVAGHELAAALARHGVTSNVTSYPKASLSVGDEILNAVTDTGSDLIVMGAYGHSRVYDFVLGAATSRVLEHMTAPVLFAS